MELKDILLGLVVGLLIGGGATFFYTSNSLNNQIDLLENEVELLNQEVSLLNSQRDNLENEVYELKEDKIDLQSQVNSRNEEIISLNSQMSSLENEINDISEQLLGDRKTLKIAMVTTGTKWREAGDYDLQDSFPKGYDDDFFIIYEIEEHYHELIYRVSMDIYIISGGTIYFDEHWTDEGTYSYESDYWYQSYYYPVDIQWLSNDFYTVIVTVTDLITGESNSKSYDFTITL